MRFWFPDGIGHLTEESLAYWYDKADSVVTALLDSYGTSTLLVGLQNNKESGDNHELSTDVD